MRIVSADERLRETRGAKVLIIGPVGIGKTTLLRTLKSTTTLFIDVEAGDLAVIDLPVPTIRIDDWVAARDLACRIGGPNPSFAPSQCYSQAHYEAIGGAVPDLDQFETIFVDSLTATSRLSFRWAEQQPEAYSERSGKKDLRSAYGLHAREMMLWLNQLQHARAKNIVFVGVLERVVDELRVATWQLQCEGGKTSRELPGIVDEILTMQFLNFGDDKPPMRAFVCSTPNPWDYPGKDRSGRLDQNRASGSRQATHQTHKPRRREMSDTQSDFFDLNTAGEQRDLIPTSTIVTVQMTIIPGNAGEGGWLKRAQDGKSEGLDLEFTVVDGKYAKRKFWERWTVEGTTAGHADAKEISRRKMRAIVECARGIRPDDKSETANAGRRLAGGYADLDRIRFIARIGIRPAEGQYQARNQIDEIITPDRKDWQKSEQISAKTVAAATTTAPASSPPAGALARPQWAQ